MTKNISKISRCASLILLAIIISSLLNVCMFTLKVKATAPQLSARQINFFDNNYGETCAEETTPKTTQTINRPSAPMPECCLTQNRNFNAIVNTANNKTLPTFTDSIISSSTNLNFENNSTHNTSRFVHPPPALLALASTVIRE